MDISILLSWKNTFQTVGWTVAICPHCQGTEAVRVDQKVWVFAVYFVPVVSIPRDHVGRCDFCSRPILVGAPRQVGLDDWSHADGLRILMRKLGVPEQLAIQRAPLDDRLNSLLSSTRDAVSANRLDVTLGITSGLILGVLVGFLIGIPMFDAGLQLGKDRFASNFFYSVSGAVLGAIIGGAVHMLVSRTRHAKRLLQAASANYQLDTERLVQLSSGYGGPVHRAVCDLRDGV